MFAFYHSEMEFHAFHRLLEIEGNALTHMAAKEQLKKADVTADGKVSAIELLCYKYAEQGCTPSELVKRKPKDVDDMGDDMSPELKAAMAALAAAQAEVAKIESEKKKLQAASEQGGVKGNKAKAELAALLSADPTALNARILTAEAAMRKLGGKNVDMPPGVVWWMERYVV